MRIKKVEIFGFKSFVDKVALDFFEGTTAVVGPNGCGKSNIVDAIRWAMGEQSAKNLRGRSMEDVIFGGSESRKPLGMAEVTLTFSNEDGAAPQRFCDYAEIAVTRRLYRDGESEYLINKTPSRLLDITELFMDTGVGARAYSIIEQGKIGMILNSKPEDRRFLIEEAAGVTKYKSRKKSALRKIEATRQNMLRLGDIVSEVRRQMGSLKRQAQKAERFKELREELRRIEILFAMERYRELSAEIEGAREKEAACRIALEGDAAALAAGEANVEEKRLLQTTKEKELSAVQEKIFHLTSEIQRVESRIELCEKEILNIVRQKERYASEGEEIERRLEDIDRRETALQEECDALTAEHVAESRRLGDEEACLEELEASEKLVAASLEEERQTLYASLTELSRMGSLQEEAQRRSAYLEERVARNRSEAVSVREKWEELQETVFGLESSLSMLQEECETIRIRKESLEETLQALRSSLRETDAALSEKVDALNRRRSRLDSLKQLEAGLEGYGGGVKTLLGEPAYRDLFGGMVADFLEVPQDLEAAVEAVLGDRLQALLSPGSDEALKGVDFLFGKRGRCTFLLPGFTAEQPLQWDLGIPLSDLVSLRSEAPRQLLPALFSGVCLVESLQPFLQGGLPVGLTLVTREGGVLTCRGELTGGGRDDLDHGLLHKKREIRDLDAEVASLTKEVDKFQGAALQLRVSIETAEEELRENEAARHRKDLEIVDRQKDLTRFREEAGRLQERIEVLSLEEEQLHEEAEGVRRRLSDVSKGREEKELRKAEAEEKIAALQEELQLKRRGLEIVRQGVTALKVAVTTLRERVENGRRNHEQLHIQRDELRGRRTLLHGLDSEGAEEDERLRTEGEKLRVELDLLYRRREEEKTGHVKLREAFDASAEEVERRESSLKDLRVRLNTERENLGNLQMKGRELRLEADHLQQVIAERYRIDLEEEKGASEPFDAERGEKRLAELRDLIDTLGEVNLTAIDEFRELEERWNFLTVQQDDLRRSLEGLQSAIAKINRTTRKRFRETFDQVNEKFREVFPRLFRGGKAELCLTDENDLLETGIDIVVQPPGKKLQNVTLLSGGEKALTAVALIFSIFLIKPSPFCMLDEVDAPLDDANIGRFNQMVREMSEISQFVIITHNKKTMEIADTLYGVTMEEPGVSKLVSVRVTDF